MCKVYTGYHGKSEIEHGLCACTVALSLRTSAQTMLYLSLIKQECHPCFEASLSSNNYMLEMITLYSMPKETYIK